MGFEYNARVFVMGSKRGNVVLRAGDALSFCHVQMPRRVWDCIVDWYGDRGSNDFWGKEEGEIKQDFGREWEAGASITPPNDFHAHTLRAIHIHHHGRAGTDIYLRYERDEFDRIVRWYNSEYEEKIAA
jgi:hypothetical protein